MKSTTTFIPSQKVLANYADILVNFALNSGSGVRKGEVVQCYIPDVAKPLYGHLQSAILKAGAHPLMRFHATGFDRDYYTLASDEQLKFFPKKYAKARADLIDHSIAIIAEHDLHELQGVDPQKIFLDSESKKLTRKWYSDKEYAGKFTWTLALYGTPAMAKEARLSQQVYWQQIINACFLDDKNPIETWKQVTKQIEVVKKKLNKLAIESFHIQAKGIDLTLKLGEKRRFVGGGGRNIPSFEIFTSPDWRGTEGFIEFNQPLYRYGSLIENIRLEFKAGHVIKATASKNQSLLRKMIARPDADKIGEFSLTDSRFSRIEKFMANTLYDENIGGKYGNTHIAIGMSYQDAYDGDLKTVTKKTLDQLGFNNIHCGEHCDMMSTQDRTVTATLLDGTKKIIYQNGQFTV
jgi:aminopeptidase